MLDLTVFKLTILLICGFLIGFSKTAGTSLSSIIIPIMVDVFPAKEATGILCLAFFIASFHAVYHYRHHIKWHYYFKLAAGTFIGLILGSFFIQEADNDAIKLTVGLIILAMLAFNVGQQRYIAFFNPDKKNILFSLISGTVIGFSSLVANAGSPIMAIYLLIHKENKADLIGTLVMFFFLIDIVKIPVNLWLKVVTYESLRLNYIMLPMMVVGGFIGILFVKWVSENRFRKLLEVLTFVGSVKLIYRPLLNLL